MKTITMTQFRREPGEYLRAVQRERRAFLITKQGKPAARLLPPTDVIEILPDGTVLGELLDTRAIR